MIEDDRPAVASASRSLRRLLRAAPDGFAAKAVFRAKEHALSQWGEVADHLSPPDPAMVGWLQLPPPSLRAKVSGKADARTFLRDGSGHQGLIWELLARSGRDPNDAGDVLDFGCGCGRTLRWWPHTPSIRLLGCDINPEHVEWCRSHLPHVQFRTTSLSPPTSFDDGSVDVIYAISIFTHLTVESQQAWLAEFRRILRGDGCLIFSVCGDRFRSRLSAEELARYEAGEAVVQFKRAEGSNLCGAFHPRAYVEGTMLSGFRLTAERAGSDELLEQDLFLADRA